jgi:hypothetical protein
MLTFRYVIKNHSVYNLSHQLAEVVPANKGMLSNTGGTSVSVAIHTWQSRLNRIRVSYRGNVVYERPVYVSY